MKNMIVWIIVILLIGILEQIIEKKLFNKEEIIYKKKAFMTNTEKDFYQKLKPLEKQYKIIPQVNLGAIIEKESSIKYRNELFRNIDYGIFTKDFKLLLLIELNDSSHKKYNRKIRDLKVHEICNKANIPIITFYTSYSNKEEYIIERIEEEIKKSTIPIENIDEK